MFFLARSYPAVGGSWVNVHMQAHMCHMTYAPIVCHLLGRDRCPCRRAWLHVSTVVNPGRDEGIDQPSFHGIPASELLSGLSFSKAFWRFDAFLRHAALNVLDAEDDSEGEQQMASAMKPDQDIVIVAHNGLKFDFPFLLSDAMRAGIGPGVLASWGYVATLDVLQATDCECRKLQCAFRAFSGSPGLRAHRALDDCIALGSVVRSISASLGVPPWVLLGHFAVRLDEDSTRAGLSALSG